MSLNFACLSGWLFSIIFLPFHLCFMVSLVLNVYALDSHFMRTRVSNLFGCPSALELVYHQHPPHAPLYSKCIAYRCKLLTFIINLFFCFCSHSIVRNIICHTIYANLFWIYEHNITYNKQSTVYIFSYSICLTEWLSDVLEYWNDCICIRIRRPTSAKLNTIQLCSASAIQP